MRNNETGRSMIEMLGVLAIIGILSAGGIAGYTMAMKNYRANKAMEQLQLVSTEIILAFGDNTNYTKLTNNANKLKLDLTSPYGGNIEVQGSVGSFNLTMNNVPDQACIKLAQIDWGDDYILGTANNVAQFTADPFTCQTTNPLLLTYITSLSGSSSGGSSGGGGSSSASAECAEFEGVDCDSAYLTCKSTVCNKRTKAEINACAAAQCQPQRLTCVSCHNR